MKKLVDIYNFYDTLQKWTVAKIDTKNLTQKKGENEIE